MSGKPFDRHEQRVFFRTVALASLVGCVGFLILAVVRGNPLTTPLLCLLPALIANGLLLGWFGPLDDEGRQ